MTLSDNALPEPAVPPGTRLLDARLHLLDRQLLAGGDPVGIVDDLEIDDATSTAEPRVTAILTDEVLATRIFGGRPPRSRLQGLPWRLVAKVGIVVELSPSGHSFDSLWVERWLGDHVIRRIPGGRRAVE
jgi:hypothetical protein